MQTAAPLIQGVASPNLEVNPRDFYAATRRLRFPMRSPVAISALGSTDSVQLRQTGIVAGLEVRVFGTVTFGGTITGTSMLYEWPLGLARAFKLSANGQSNLILARGLTTRAMEFATNPRLDDTGVPATFGTTAVTTGSLKLPTDDWGTSGGNALNPGATVASVGTYTVDLTFFLPVAADQMTLIGSVYAQSSATNLTLDVDWQTQASLLTLGGTATFAQALNWQVTGLAYSIPNVGGKFVVPDLTQFHQLAEYRLGGLTQGVNEPVLPGTGVGRKFLRAMFQVYSGTPAVPIVINSANYSTLGWAYGGNDVPEAYPSGMPFRAMNLRVAGVDLGANWGIGLWDFASQFALRDAIDEGTVSDLRLQIGLVNAPTAPSCQILQETLFAAPVGA
jgi:hypothetical protein